MANWAILSDNIPKLYSFIVVRRENFGGYIFNPYLLRPLPMNEVGLRIIDLCDGSRTIYEIIEVLCEEFQLPFNVLKSTVLDALNSFSEYFAIQYKQDKLRQNTTKKLSLSPISNKNQLSAPLSVLWDITYLCNLKCKHCLVSGGEQFGDELSLDEVKGIIDQLVEMKVFNICFLGGEPLMRRDFLKILKYASKWNIGITFSTNGSLIDEQVINKLKTLKIFQVQVSLDGLEETHNRIRGISSSFEKAIQAISRLVESGIRVGVSTTVNKLNLKELDALIQFSISLGSNYFKAIPFMPVGRGRNAKYLCLLPKDVKEYVTAICKSKEKYQNQIHIYAEETYSWLLEKPIKSSIVTSSIKNVCAAGTSQLVIAPNGLTFPCPFLHDFVAGDLRKDKVSHIWDTSKVLAMFREIDKENLKGKCSECSYVPVHCRGGCRAAAYNNTGDFYAEDPMCWYNL